MKIVRNKSKEKPGITPGFPLFLIYDFLYDNHSRIFRLAKYLRYVNTCVFQHLYDFSSLIYFLRTICQHSFK
jgi:hypothetical protein